jgi:hypothetical protein
MPARWAGRRHPRRSRQADKAGDKGVHTTCKAEDRAADSTASKKFASCGTIRSRSRAGRPSRPTPRRWDASAWFSPLRLGHGGRSSRPCPGSECSIRQRHQVAQVRMHMHGTALEPAPLAGERAFPMPALTVAIWSGPTQRYLSVTDEKHAPSGRTLTPARFPSSIPNLRNARIAACVRRHLSLPTCQPRM